MIKTHAKYFVSLPTEEAHSGHPTGGSIAGLSQRVNEKVAAKIAELVGDGITDIHEVPKFLHTFVMHELFQDSPPDPNDRAYFPTDDDLRNHIYMTKKALELLLTFEVIITT